MMGRTEAIRRIRAALQDRSGRAWSVRGGRGTAYGWIEVDAPPRRRRWDWHGLVEDSPQGGGHMSASDRKALAEMLGLAGVHPQGVSVSPEERDEYVARAEGTWKEVKA